MLGEATEILNTFGVAMQTLTKIGGHHVGAGLRSGIYVDLYRVDLRIG